MSTDRDTTRIVRSWLRADETETADRVLGAVLDRLDATPQRRRATWWPAGRMSSMNRFVTIGAAAATVVVAIVLGVQLLGSPTGIGGPGDDPTPTPEASAAPSNSEPSPTPSIANLSLPEFPVAVTATVTAGGWSGDPAGGTLIKGRIEPPAPDGAGIITFVDPGYHVYGDPCEWSSTRPDTPATTVDDLVAALAAQTSRDASEPVDITLDGYSGKSITLRVPEEADFAQCDEGKFASWATPTEEAARYHQAPGQIDNLWIVDVEGQLVIIDWGYYEATPQSIVDELRGIVESITFEAR
ncbi:MAG: hypothetical protein M3Y40_07695 [Chloroflexota bacterium]|jgi:hypothetical protein|nr:hypothetical protein [Chloroflexota bacterium]